MIRASRALALLACGALALVDCALGDFCTQGAMGCADPGCHDGMRDGDESDVDCGGHCAPCGLDQGCAAPSDCGSGRCVGGHCCAAPCGVWASSFGAIADDLATSVATAPDGTVYVVGLFHGIVDFGGGPLTSAGDADVFVLALDASGNHRWSLRLGSPVDEITARLTLDAAGHLVIALASASTTLDLGGGALDSPGSVNLYAVALDAAGNHVWSRAYPTKTQALPSGLAALPGGDVILVGSFLDVDLGNAGKLVSGNGGAFGSILVARLDATGAPVWGEGFGEVYKNYPTAVAVDAQGYVYLAALYSNVWSFGDGTLLPFTGGTYGIAVAKLDDAGHTRWSRGYPGVFGTHGVRPNGIAVDDRGRVWVAGVYGPPIDFGSGPLPAGIFESAFVLSLNAGSGKLVWARGFGEHTMEAHAIIPDGHGGVVIAGLYKGNAALGGAVTLDNGLSQLFVARFDASGQPLWARNEQAVMTSPASDTGTGPALRDTGIGGALLAPGPGAERFTLAGGFRGTLDIGTGPLASTGMTDSPDAFVGVLVQ